MSLPYRWYPDGADYKYDLEPGDILAWEHAVYRVQWTEQRPDDEKYPLRVCIRPIGITGDDVRDRDHDRPLKAPAHYRWNVFPTEHYPVCAKCQEPLPCREQMAKQIAAREAENLDRYTVAGVCPGCTEPVTDRQKGITWEDNVVVPAGPPVTFHLRRACWSAAVEYEQRWQAAAPDERCTTLSCRGSVTRHYDGTHDCTEAKCPGRDAYHPSVSNHYPGYTDCRCVAGIPARTAGERTEQDQEQDLRWLFEDES
jgi:hypothetical protein